MTPPPPTQPSSVLLPERTLADVLLVRAFEEADPEGSVLARGERERATREARQHLSPSGEPTGDELARYLGARARALRTELGRRVPAVARLDAAHAPRATVPVLLVLLALGLATNFLGAEKRIHVLANPLMALLLWNLAVYALLLLWRSGGHALSARVGRLGLGLSGRPDASERGGDVTRRALARFAADHVAAARELYLCRGRRLLHLGAFALVLGALAGLYLRGLVLEYETTWESTFLTREAAEGVLGVLFAPAALLTGFEVPTLATPDQDAARWIHLYAVTVGLVVLVPRALLAWAAGRRAGRLAEALSLPVSDGYFRRLVAAHQGQGLRIALVPYSHEPARETREGLLALLHDLFGARARVIACDPLPYGAELEDLEHAADAADGGTPRFVLAFGLAQTPETEVHGRLVADLRRRHDGEPVLVLVDGTGYRERLGGGDTALRRATEHRRSWDRVLRDAGEEALHVDLGAETTETLLEAAGALLTRRGDEP